MSRPPLLIVKRNRGLRPGYASGYGYASDSKYLLLIVTNVTEDTVPYGFRCSSDEISIFKRREGAVFFRLQSARSRSPRRLRGLGVTESVTSASPRVTGRLQ